MTPPERRSNLEAIRDDLALSLDEANAKMAPLEEAYNKAMAQRNRIQEQLRQLTSLLSWFAAQNDPDSTEADLPF